MKIDFFLGRKNKKVTAIAGNLGFDSIFFVKEISSFNEIKKYKGQKNYDAVLIKTSSLESLQKMIDRASNYFDLVFVLGMTDKINRTALENKKVHALLSPEFERHNDYINQRNSGLNQVLCKIARDKNKTIIINFNDILSSKSKNRAVLLGRIMQNITLCRKYKVNFRIGTFASGPKGMRSVSDLNSFCASAGMSTKQVKEVFDSGLIL